MSLGQFALAGVALAACWLEGIRQGMELTIVALPSRRGFVSSPFSKRAMSCCRHIGLSVWYLRAVFQVVRVIDGGHVLAVSGNDHNACRNPGDLVTLMKLPAEPMLAGKVPEKVLKRGRSNYLAHFAVSA
jgi:hypothetical protein